MSPASPPVVSLTTLVLVALSLAAPEALAQPVQFQRGDANADGELNLTDPIFTLNHLFLSAGAPPCADAADAQDDGKLDTADAVYTLSYLFRGDRPPPEPFGECGLDPAGDNLGCTSFRACGQEEETGLREAWLLRIPRFQPSNIALDPSGNVYVGGGIGPPFVGWVKKYDPEGNEVWSITPPATRTIHERTLSVDALGSVFVTAYGHCDGDQDARDVVTAKYDSSGQQVWLGCYAEGSIVDTQVVDRTGNVYLQAGPLVKFTRDGQLDWQARPGPGFGYGLRPTLAVDAEGNAFVGGSGNDSGFVVWKYDPEGNLAWRMAEADHKDGYALTQAADEVGNVYVGAEVWNSDDAADAEHMTVKFSSQGERVWTANQKAIPREMAVDGTGNLYTSGIMAGTWSWVTAKYDSGGQELWVSEFGLPDLGLLRDPKLLLDSQGCAYVTGNLIDGGGNLIGGVTVKYDAAGREVWVQRYGWSPGRTEGVSDVAVDPVTGNLHVVILSRIDEDDTYAVIVKYVPE